MPVVTEEQLVEAPDLVLLFDGDRPPDLLVATMVERLRADPTLDAVGVGEAVTDAVKVVDAEGRVTATLDRSKLVVLGVPAVVRRTAAEARQIGAIGLV